MLDRRLFTLMLLGALVIPASSMAHAEDGDGEHSESEHEGGGRSDSTGSGRGDSRSDKGGKRNGKSGRDGNSGNSSSDEDDDDRIRKAVRNGEAKPLKSILSDVRSRYQGQVVRVRLSNTGSNFTYNIRIIDPNNNLIDLQVEAATGQIVAPAGIY